MPAFGRYRCAVLPEWIDENHHLNMGYYVVAFDQATDAFFDHLGLTRERMESTQVATFTLESHVNYLQEVLEGDRLRFTTQLIAFDEKRIHYFHHMIHDERGYVAATNELLSLHVSRVTRRGKPMDRDLQSALAELLQQHGRLPRPPQLGRSIGLAAGRAS